jgi:peptidoglycan/xylan/chitin deacetylase (PgdA/CDA1 family)
MGAEKVTRRVLLTVGGLALLDIYTSDPALHDPAQHDPALHDPALHDAALHDAGQHGPARHDAAQRTPGARPAASAPARQPRTPPTEPPQLAVARPGRRGPGRTPLAAIDDGPRAIALTIDDGPSPVYTPQVLRLLARYRITATFSMIGIQAQAYPAVAREVAEAGHLIANHTWTHLDLQWLPPALVTEQMTRAADAIHTATGRVPGLFRAPYGAWSPFVLAQCARTGLTPLGWSVDPRDWSRPGVPAIVANIMRNTHTGSIILEHDGGGNRAQTVAALKVVIPRLLDAGYRFRTP